MPDTLFDQLNSDPKFKALSPEAQRIVMGRYDPKFAKLSPQAQEIVHRRLAGQSTTQAAPSAASASEPSESTSWTASLLGGTKKLAGEAFFQSIERPAADVNRLGYSIIGSKAGLFVDPEEFKKTREKLGLYGAERLPTDTPQGWLEHVSAVASPLEGALLATPAGRAVFGLGVVTRAVTNSDDLADAVEGTGGLVMLTRDLIRGGKILRRKFKLFTPAEKAYTEAKAAVIAPESEAKRAQEAADLARSKVLDAKQQAAAVASNAEASTQVALDKAEAEHVSALQAVGQAESGMTVPTKDIRDRMSLVTDGPTAERAGKMIQAVEEDVHALSTGEEPVGAASKALKLSAESKRLRSVYEKIADAKEVMLPAGTGKERGSASAAVIRRRATQYLSSLIKGQGSTSEREVAREIGMLGIRGLYDPNTGEVFKAATPDKYKELLAINKNLKPVYQSVKFSTLSRLYSKARTIALSPREFPISQNVAKREYTRMLGSLRITLGALADADPELRQAFIDGQRHVRRVEEPFIRETAARVLSPGITPRKAFETLMADDPTTIERLFLHAKGPERSALSHAMFDEMVLESSDPASGVTDYSKLAKRWKSLPGETRQLLSNFNNGAAKMVMDEAIAKVNGLESAKATTKEAMAAIREARKERTEMRYRGRRLLRAVSDAGKVTLEKEAINVKRTLEALAAAQKRAERIGELKRTAPRWQIKKIDEEGPVLRFDYRGSYRMFAKAHAVMGIVDILHGNVIRAVIQGGESLMFRRGKLVREALETPINTPRGKEIALALHAVLAGFVGPPMDEVQQDDVGAQQFRGHP